MNHHTSHVDTFVRDNLPPPEQMPDFLFTTGELQYPGRLNSAAEVLDKKIAQGYGAKNALLTPNETWSYRDLYEKSNRIAHVLVEDLGLVPGNRVLLRAPNNPMLVACWFGVIKAGGVAVATMPLLRKRDLEPIINKAQVQFALCDERLMGELSGALETTGSCSGSCSSTAPERPARGRNWSNSWPQRKPLSIRSRLPATTLPLSPSPAAPRASPKARCISIGTS